MNMYLICCGILLANTFKASFLSARKDLSVLLLCIEAIVMELLLDYTELGLTKIMKLFKVSVRTCIS